MSIPEADEKRITALREACKALIGELPQSRRPMALTKMDEMFFWIRSAIGRADP